MATATPYYNPTRQNDVIPLSATTSVRIVDLWEIEARMDASQSHERGTYFAYLLTDNTDGTSAVLVANLQQRVENIDRDSVWRQRREVSQILHQLPGRHKIAITSMSPTAKSNAILQIVTALNRRSLGVLSSEAVLREFFLNSQAAYEATVHKLATGALSVRETLPLHIDHNDYSHIACFSRLYHLEMQLLCGLLGTGEETLTVVDDATGFGHAILTFARFLPPEALRRIRFIGLDKRAPDLRFPMEATGRYTDLRAEWYSEDIRHPRHVERLRALNGGQPIDLLLVNHAISHLDDRTPLGYILEWLRAVKCMLVVSVSLSGHSHHAPSSQVHQFTIETLRELAVEVENHTKRRFHADLRFAHYGILVFHHSGQSIRNRATAMFGCEIISCMEQQDHESLDTSLEKLFAVACHDLHAYEVAVEIVRAMASGTTGTATGKGIAPVTLEVLATYWRENRRIAEKHLNDQPLPNVVRGVFARVWSEWATYTGLAEKARRLAQNEATRHQAQALAQIADFVSHHSVDRLLHFLPQQVADLLAQNRWETLLEYAVLAHLYGEGRFYQTLKLMIDRYAPAALRAQFWTLVNTLVEAVQLSHRRVRPLKEINFAHVRDTTMDFVRVVEPVNVTRHNLDSGLLRGKRHYN